MPDDLIQRLEAVGGMLTGDVDRFGFHEVITPLGEYHKSIWMTPNSLNSSLTEWEAVAPSFRPRLCVVFKLWADVARANESESNKP